MHLQTTKVEISLHIDTVLLLILYSPTICLEMTGAALGEQQKPCNFSSHQKRQSSFSLHNQNFEKIRI